MDTTVEQHRITASVGPCRDHLGYATAGLMGEGAPFRFQDLDRWPTGAEGVEIIAGALCFAGQFGDEDVAVARRVYPEHEVRLEDGDLWVLPHGSDGVADHLARFVKRHSWAGLVAVICRVSSSA